MIVLSFGNSFQTTLLSACLTTSRGMPRNRNISPSPGTERLHRQFLEVVKNELEGLGIEDLNNVQSLILFNIGKNEYTVGELTGRGYYLGSNVSYNVRKMVEHGYLVQERSTHDRRSVRVRLTDKGIALWEKLDSMFD